MRAKRGIVRKRKHKKILKQAKGYRMTRSRLYKVAKEAVLHAGAYAYHGRKLRKRDMRRLWIQRINAALSETNLSYSKFIKKLKDNKVEINRKILADLVVSDIKTFFKIVDKIK
jgi:large subunit ribosomal protein L20